jgi:8-oxo-dGTP pyrophosphatase MutT (NUDIX family)
MNPLLQAGAVPFRIRDSRLEFLLVTSNRGNWIFPKGIVEPGDTPEKAALKEASEEAGVFGEILPGPLGSYGDRKWTNDCEIHMFLLQYAGDCEPWEEGSLRYRKWCSYEDALRLIKKNELREILMRALRRLEGSEQGSHPHQEGKAQEKKTQEKEVKSSAASER